MINEVKYIVMLVSNNYTLLLYKKLKRRRIKVEYISAPVGIAKSCKRVIRFNESDIEVVIDEIKKNNLIIKSIYKKVTKDKKVTYVLIKRI